MPVEYFEQLVGITHLVVVNADNNITKFDFPRFCLLETAQTSNGSAATAGHVHDEHAVSNRQIDLILDHRQVARADAELGTTDAPVLQQLRHHAFRDTHRHCESNAG